MKKEDTTNTFACSGYFDGEKIVLDKPLNVAPNTRVWVAVAASGNADEEREDWYRLSLQRLAEAYGDDEPEYEWPGDAQAIEPVEAMGNRRA